MITTEDKPIDAESQKPIANGLWNDVVAKRSGQALSRLIELVCFALAAPIVGLLFFPENPTGLSTGFPWVAAAPLIYTCRYGCLQGVACAVLMAGFINLPIDAYRELAAAHTVLGLATIALCLIMGDIASTQIKRFKRSQAENHYLRKRLDTFSSDYHVLKISHGILQEHMAGQRLSLREALQQLKPMFHNQQHESAASEFLAVLSNFCSIQVAGIYRPEKKGRISRIPVATQGDMPELNLYDPVLRLALEEKKTVHIRHEAVRKQHQTDGLLVVVPLVDADGQLHGIVAIKDMHFMAFQEQNLKIMAVMGSFVGNQLAGNGATDTTKAAHFISEIETSLQYLKQHQTPSVILSLQFEPTDQGLQTARYVVQSVRHLDAAWLSHDGQNSPMVSLLFPLMTVESSEAFLQRLDAAIAQQSGIALPHVLQYSQVRALVPRDTLATCEQFFGVNLRQEAEATELMPGGLQGAA